MSAHVRAALLGNTSVSAKQPSDWEDYVDFQALRDGSKEINPSNWSYGCFLPSCIFPFNTAYSACTWPLYFLSVLFEGEWKLWTSSLKDRGSPTLNVLVPDSQMSCPSPEWDATLQGSKTQNTLSRKPTVSTTTAASVRVWRLSFLKDLDAYFQDIIRNSLSLGVYCLECMAGLTYTNQRDR